MSKTFLEELPSSCPPENATDAQLLEVYRFVDASGVSEACFLSHAAAGQVPPNGMDSCRWRSCSLLEEGKAIRMAALPNFKDRVLAKLNIPAGSGMSTPPKRGHIDFWPFSTFRPLENIEEVKAP